MTPSPPIPVVLVGCGAVSQLFYKPSLRALENSGRVQVLGVVDPMTKARDNLRAEFPRAQAVSALSEIRWPGHAPALAIIASPPKFHREHVEAAFDRGFDVLCEKPLATSAAAGEAMVAAAMRASRVLAVGHYKRFFPGNRVLKNLIDQRTFGVLQSVEIAEGGRFGWAAATDSFFRRDQTPGGVMLDIGVHVMDLLLWWLGNPTRFAYRDDARGGVEANCRLDAEFTGGVKVNIRLSRDWPTLNCYVFRFERATVTSRVNSSNQLEFTLDGLPTTFAAELRDPLPPHPAPSTSALETNPQAFIAQLLDVCTVVKTRGIPFVGGTDGVRAVRFIEQCYALRQPLPEPWRGEA